MRPAAGNPVQCAPAPGEELDLTRFDQPWQKRLLDCIGACVLLIGFLPIGAAIAAAVKLSSRGPILFRQSRVGRAGRPFTILKFRTMEDRAEHQQDRLRVKHALDTPAFKLRNDPRVTAIGRWLRRHSLDELPQLWNVLRGEMSLVGPRPLPLSEAALIDASIARRRHSVRPGMTGLWQISGRRDPKDFADWMRLDLAYIETWSMRQDFRILIATVPVVWRGGSAW